jgi:hypothetical protein
MSKVKHFSDEMSARQFVDECKAKGLQATKPQKVRGIQFGGPSGKIGNKR